MLYFHLRLTKEKNTQQYSEAKIYGWDHQASHFITALFPGGRLIKNAHDLIEVNCFLERKKGGWAGIARRPSAPPTCLLVPYGKTLKFRGAHRF